MNNRMDGGVVITRKPGRMGARGHYLGKNRSKNIPEILPPGNF